MKPWNKPEWQNELEEDETDPHIEALTDVAVVVLVLVVSLICASVVYKLFTSYSGEVIAAWSFVP